jgi:RNA polymerase sigma factor (sigma-70 family)
MRYRMLLRITVVQRRTTIEDEKNYLIRSVINQSINLRNKRKKAGLNEVWLPEPLAIERADKNTELQEIASYSMLVLLEELSARERAVFVLKEAFEYAHAEIADFLDVSVEHSRKLLSRAKAKLKQSNWALKPSVASDQLNRYVSAIREGNIEALKELFTHDIALYADGGPGLNVAAKLMVGQEKVSDLLLMIYRKYQTDFSIIPAIINHQPALLYYNSNQLISCQVFHCSLSGNIIRVNIVLDPKKLKNVRAY